MNITRVSCFHIVSHRLVPSSHACSLNAVHTIFISEYWTLNTFWLRVLHGLCAFCVALPLHSRSLFAFVCRLSNHSKQNLISMYEFYYCRFLFFDFYFLAWMWDVFLRFRFRALPQFEFNCCWTLFFSCRKRDRMSYAFVAKIFRWKCEWKTANFIMCVCLHVCEYSLFFFFTSLPICVWLSLSLEVHTKLLSPFSEALCVYTYLLSSVLFLECSNVRMGDALLLLLLLLLSMLCVHICIVNITTDFR